MSDHPTRTAAEPTNSLADPAATTGGSFAALPASPVSADRYALGDEIARGGMGAVYRATDTAFDREVAVKLLLDKFAPASGAARRFHDEARITGQLQHPGIPPAHDLGTLPDGRPFLAMKLIKGETLDELLKGGADRGRFVAAFEKVCEAVAYAHSRGVVHRDLKPQNVMVGAFGEVQVMDWGLAKVLAGGGRRPAENDPDETAATGTEVKSLRDSEDLLTQAGSVLGTPAYMPPEQALGAVHEIDRRSDVFGLGGILAAVLTGKPPFVSDTAETTRVMAARGQVADCFARLDASGADLELVALCKRCLSPEKGNRPADSGEVARAVAELRSAADERARRAERDRAAAEVRAAEQWKRRRVVLAAAAVLLAVGGGWAWASQRRAGERAAEEARGAEAVGGLLDQAEAALAAGDADRAAPFLDQAARRAAGTPAHANRLAADQKALATLRQLDDIDIFRWTLVEERFPSREKEVERWAAVFERIDIVPGKTPAAEAARRVNDSPIQTQLLAVLDGWLSRSKSEAVREILEAADSDAPFRSEVRRLLSTGDRDAVLAVAQRPEWANQPTGLILAYAESALVPKFHDSTRGLLTRAAQKRPNEFSLLMQLGNSHGESTHGRADEKVRWFQAAVTARSRNVAAHYNLGNSLREKGNLDGAIAAYREAIRLDPNYIHPHNNLGNVLSVTGDVYGAIACYREAIRRDPNHTKAHYNLGDAFREKGNLDGAIAAYREAIRLDPNYASAHSNLGNALLDKGDVVGAIVCYRDAIRLDPKLAPPLNNLGGALLGKGDADGAIASFRAAIQLRPHDPDYHSNLGKALNAKGDVEGAIASYRDAIRLDPKNARPHSPLGNIFAKRGDRESAIACFREAIRLDPKFVDAHYNLGNFLYRQGHLDDAIACYREAIRLDPKDAPAHSNLGNALLDKGDVDGAIVCYRDAIRLDSKLATAHGNFGLALVEKGNLEEALTAFREAVRLNPLLVGAHLNLGDLYWKFGRTDDATTAFRAALAINPKSAYAREGLDFCLRLKRGEIPPAPPPRPAR